jgi:hypothetical protein
MLLIPLSLPRSPADSGPEPALPDRIPPAAITDLKATTGANPGDIRLEWQATGDDGKTGTAHDYRVLQSPDPLTPASAGAASRHSPGWSPRPSGQRERRPLGRLPAGTRTYVALVARDEAGNESPLSNVVEILTPAAGDLVEAGTAGEKGAKPGGNRPAPSPTPDESKAEGKGKGGEGESGGKNPLFGAPERTPAEFEDVKVKPLFGPEGQSRFLELTVPLPRVRGESPGGADEDTLEMKEYDLLVRYERMAEKAVSAGRIAPNDRKAVLEYFERVKKMVGNGK